MDFERNYDSSSEEEREHNRMDPCRVTLCLDFTLLVQLFGARKVAASCQHIINKISDSCNDSDAHQRLIKDCRTPEPSVYKTSNSETALKIALLISEGVSKLNKNRSIPIPIMGIFCQKEAEEMFDIELINCNLRKGIQDINVFITSRIYSDISTTFTDEYKFRYAKISTGSMTIEGYFIEPLHYENRSIAIGKSIVYTGPYVLCLARPREVTSYRRSVIGHVEEYLARNNNPTTIWKDPKTAFLSNLERQSNKFVLTIGYGITSNAETSLVIGDAYLALSNLFEELNKSSHRAFITNEVYEKLNPEDFPEYNIVLYQKQDHRYFYGSIIYAVLEKNVVISTPIGVDLLQLTE